MTWRHFWLSLQKVLLNLDSLLFISLLCYILFPRDWPRPIQKWKHGTLQILNRNRFFSVTSQWIRRLLPNSNTPPKLKLFEMKSFLRLFVSSVLLHGCRYKASQSRILKALKSTSLPQFYRNLENLQLLRKQQQQQQKKNMAINI